MLDNVLIVLLGLVLPAAMILGRWPKGAATTFDTDAKITGYWGNSLLLSVLAAAVAYVWLRAGRPLAALGLQWPSASTLWWSVLFVLGAAVLYALDAWLDLRSEIRRTQTRERWRRDTPFMPSTWRELVHYSALAASAGFCEELVYRGYFIRYLLSLFGSSVEGYAGAILMPAFIFSLMHLYQGWMAVWKIVGMSIVFGVVFVATGSIWVLVVIHFLADLAGGFLTTWFSSTEKPLL